MVIKSILIILSLTWFLKGCSNPQQVANKPAKNCPSPPNSSPRFKIEYEGDFYRKLKTVDIIESPDLITFQSQDYDFIFCDSNGTFITKEGTYKGVEDSNKSYEESLKELSDPPYQTIELDNKIYQYRVILEPNPFPDFKVEPKQVILELIKPQTEEPQQYTLYTLKQVIEKKTGIQLGIPKITANVIYNEQFYWSISPEQGEGNGGIATIVNYNPELDKINIIQPSGIINQQINDLVITGDETEPIFWLAMQRSGEGNPYLPGMGLISYHTKTKNLTSYNARNSNLIGIMPYQLKVRNEQLWVTTGNGICQIKWQQIKQSDSWKCWQFLLQADIPEEGLEVYSSLLDTSPKTKIIPDENRNTVNVLWWSPQDNETQKGRYEIVHDSAFSVTLEEKGGMSWSDFYEEQSNPNSWQSKVYWPGREWLWNGNQFIRPFDGVSLSYFGGGPKGISTWNIPSKQRPEIYALRGNLELIKLTKTSTSVNYYSGWVDDSLLQPYLTIIPIQESQNMNPNPLEKFSEN
ncbi:MAG: hypothetical protein AB4062_01675 [Crocosphaera sp.]